MSLARRHRERILAEKLAIAQGNAPSAAAAPEIDENDPSAGEYRQQLASLHNDLRALHDIQSVAEKIERKRTMIHAYLPWVDGALAAGEQGRAVQDEIVVTMLVWALDIGEWQLAIDIGEHVLNHGLALPERYKRTPACLIAEEVADRAKVDALAVPAEVLGRVSAITSARDMPDQVRAKLLRAIGLNLMAQAEDFDPAAETAVAGGKAALVDAALSALRGAVKLDQKVGVKKQIEQLERTARQLAEAAGAAAPN